MGPVRDASGLRLRRARVDDLPALVRHRAAMWEDIGGFGAGAIRAEAISYRRWASRRLRSGRLVGWVVEGEDGTLAGSGMVWLVESLPRPGMPETRRPYILAMYTHPSYRGRGVASSIVRAAVAWSRAHGFGRITLHGSKMGRPVYARLGFERTWEMRLELRSPTAVRKSAPPRGADPRRARAR